MKSRIVLICFFSVISTFIFGQGNFISQEKPKVKEVFESKSITYYGLDFSHFKLYNMKKVGTEESVIKYIPAWIEYFESKKGEPSLNELFKFNVKTNFELLYRYKALADNWISFSINTLNNDSIQSIVNSYPSSDLNEIGLVIIVECFDKETENVIVNYTFFNIQTKEILWSIKLRGDAGRAGMTDHWGKGLVNSYLIFEQIYKSAEKSLKKKK